MTVFGAYQRAERTSPLEQLEAGLADRFFTSKPEQGLGAGVPRADLTAVGHRKRRIGGVLEEIEEIAV